MRFRADSWHRAGERRARDLGQLSTVGWADDFVAELEATEPAQLGDVWRMLRRADGIVLGYALTCPVETCDQGVHMWTHGVKCPRHNSDAPCKFGERPGQDSCWLWTGTPEAGDLSATPSLHSPLELGGCGFHGFLTNGVLA